MEVLSTVIPVILAIVLGKVLSVKALVSRDAIDGMKWLVSNIMLPIVIFNSLLSFTFTKETLIVSLGIYAIFTIVLLVALQIGKKRNPDSMSSFLYAGTEGGMMGYPLYIALYGAAELSNLLVLDLGNILFAFTFFIVLINIANNKDSNTKEILEDSLKSPLVIVTAISILLNVSGLAKQFLTTDFALVYSGTVSMLTSPVSCLVLISVGYDLSLKKDVLKPVLQRCAIRMAVMTILGAIVLFVFKGQLEAQKMKVAVLLYFALPPMFITPMFIKDDNERSLIATLLSIYSLITVAVFVVIALYVPL